MALRLREYGHLMLPFIQQSKAEGRFKAEEWFSFGEACLAVPPTPLMPAANAAWRAGMQLMRSSGEPPDMDLYAKVTRPYQSSVEPHEQSGNLIVSCMPRRIASKDHCVVSHVQPA